MTRARCHFLLLIELNPTHLALSLYDTHNSQRSRRKFRQASVRPPPLKSYNREGKTNFDKTKGAYECLKHAESNEIGFKSLRHFQVFEIFKETRFLDPTNTNIFLKFKKILSQTHFFTLNFMNLIPFDKNVSFVFQTL